MLRSRPLLRFSRPPRPLDSRSTAQRITPQVTPGHPIGQAEACAGCAELRADSAEICRRSDSASRFDFSQQLRGRRLSVAAAAAAPAAAAAAAASRGERRASVQVSLLSLLRLRQRPPPLRLGSCARSVVCLPRVCAPSPLHFRRRRVCASPSPALPVASAAAAQPSAARIHTPPVVHRLRSNGCSRCFLYVFAPSPHRLDECGGVGQRLRAVALHHLHLGGRGRIAGAVCRHSGTADLSAAAGKVGWLRRCDRGRGYRGRIGRLGMREGGTQGRADRRQRRRNGNHRMVGHPRHRAKHGGDRSISSLPSEEKVCGGIAHPFSAGSSLCVQEHRQADFSAEFDLHLHREPAWKGDSETIRSDSGAHENDSLSPMQLCLRAGVIGLRLHPVLTRFTFVLPFLSLLLC